LFITRTTDIGAQYGDVRPFDDALLHKLYISRVDLLDDIDSSVAFVDELGAVGCITWPQREHVVNILQPRDRNGKLLEFLARRSVADFKEFIQVLSKEQPHLALKLVTDEGEIFVSNLCFSDNVYVYLKTDRQTDGQTTLARQYRALHYGVKFGWLIERCIV